MPELPQVRALAERLDELLAAATFRGADPLHFTALKTVEPTPESLEGRTVSGASSRGKWLTLDLGGPRILVHLSQSGRVVIEDPPKATRPRGGVVRLRFDGRPSVMVKEFGTDRRAGWWVLSPGEEGPLAKLGPEAGTDAFDEVLRTSEDRRRLHTMLRDQRTVAGIGRGYADDILHRAALSPYASLASLGSEDRDRLVAAAGEVLSDAIEGERERTGGLDETSLANVFTIHGRWGSACPRCGEDLRRVSYESHEVTYCPRCQTGGRVLADRRFSRLIR